MIEVTRVEQELAELERQLQQSFLMFDQLAQVQQQFAALAQTHRRFEESIDKHNSALLDFQQGADRRFESMQANLHSQLAQLQTQQQNFDRRLTDEIGQRLQALKRELEQRSTTMAQAVEIQQKTVETAMRELEDRLHSEFDVAIEAMKQPAVPQTYVEKLDVGLRNTRLNVRTMERQIGALQIWLMLVTFGALVTLVLEVSPPLFSSR